MGKTRVLPSLRGVRHYFNGGRRGNPVAFPIPTGSLRSRHGIASRSLAMTVVFLLICFINSSYVFTPPVFAQQIPTDVGAEERAIRKPLMPRVPEDREAPEVEEPLEEEEAPELPEKEVFIRQINVLGNTVISDKEIKKITSGFENRTILLSELQECIKQITTLYRGKGYVTSQAYFPPQKIVEGTVLIMILEGKVGAVKVQGEKHFKPMGISRLVNLRKKEVFKVQRLEDSLVRMNRNPDITGRAVLAPGEEKETTDVVISVKDKFPIHVGHEFDNLGTKFSGRHRQNIIFSHNDLLSLNDRLVSRFIISDRHNFIGTANSYSLPLDARGTVFNMNFSHVALELGKALKELEVRGRTTTFGPSFTAALFMTPQYEGNFNVGMDFTRVRTRINATEDSNDVLRVLRFGPAFTEFDRWGRTVLSGEFSQGFSEFLGASDKKDKNSSRVAAGAQFFSTSLGLARFQKLWFDQVLIVRGTTQFTPDRLVSSEGYRIGGMDTVRGYPEGEYLGDKGYNGSAELRIPPYFFPESFSIFGFDFKPRQAIQFALFFDIGRAWLQEPRAGEIDDKILIGLGGGLVFEFLDHFSGRVYFASAQGDDSQESGPARIHFAVSSDF